MPCDVTQLQQIYRPAPLDIASIISCSIYFCLFRSLVSPPVARSVWSPRRSTPPLTSKKSWSLASKKSWSLSHAHGIKISKILQSADPLNFNNCRRFQIKYEIKCSASHSYKSCALCGLLSLWFQFENYFCIHLNVFRQHACFGILCSDGQEHCFILPWLLGTCL